MAYEVEADSTFRAYYVDHGVRGALVPSWTDGITTVAGGIITPGGTWAVPGDPNSGYGIDLEFDYPTSVSSYGWEFTDGFYSGFQNWQFYGSADRVNFELLSDPGEIWPSGYSAVEHKAYRDIFKLSSVAKFKYYRITIIHTMYGSTISPAEIILSAKETEVTPPAPAPTGRNFPRRTR